MVSNRQTIERTLRISLRSSVAPSSSRQSAPSLQENSRRPKRKCAVEQEALRARQILKKEQAEQEMAKKKEKAAKMANECKLKTIREQIDAAERHYQEMSSNAATIHPAKDMRLWTRRDFALKKIHRLATPEIEEEENNEKTPIFLRKIHEYEVELSSDSNEGVEMSSETIQDTDVKSETQAEEDDDDIVYLGHFVTIDD